MSAFEDGGRRDQSNKLHSGKGQIEACRVPDGPTPPKQPQEHFPPANKDKGNVVMSVRIAQGMDIKEKIMRTVQIIATHANLKAIWA